MRQSMSGARDEHIFRRTAVRTRVVNIIPNIPRGGIRF